ncbi:MAG: hypothetical protein QM658_18000 [Gordonia sp. (in: high G+C Gram-positive bacteria)]
MTLLDDRRTSGSGTRQRPSSTGSPGASGTRTSRTKEPAGRVTRSRTAQRALDRRSQRVGYDPAATAEESLLARIRRIPFIIPIVMLVLGALSLTLYLSTKSAQDSYGLEDVRTQNQQLIDRRDELKKIADAGDAAPDLGDKAAKYGMVPASGAVQIAVGADGKATMKGDPAPADGKELNSINPAPDPTDAIDAKKVDDSTGLNGGARPSPTVTSAAPAAPGAGDAGADQSPAPNVLPSSPATPNRNATPNR